MAINKALQLLSSFYYKNVCSFIELCNAGGYSSDLGGYYIRQLINDGFIEKIDRGQYQILPKGKHFLVTTQDKPTLSRRARMSIALIIARADTYVVTQRTAQPFIGRVEWPTGSVKAGESLAVAANRIACERLEIEPILRFHGFFRRIDTYGEEVFDDKLFAIHTGEVPADSPLLHQSKVGENHTYNKEELIRAISPSRSLIDIFEYAQSKQAAYFEKRYALEPIDLSLE
jgi:predicted transcriptional regulator/ADP-ribose pyrophosphatase YjhB (NUDIX family)